MKSETRSQSKEEERKGIRRILIRRKTTLSLHFPPRPWPLIDRAIRVSFGVLSLGSGSGSSCQICCCLVFWYSFVFSGYEKENKSLSLLLFLCNDLQVESSASNHQALKALYDLCLVCSI